MKSLAVHDVPTWTVSTVTADIQQSKGTSLLRAGGMGWGKGMLKGESEIFLQTQELQLLHEGIKEHQKSGKRLRVPHGLSIRLHHLEAGRGHIIKTMHTI